ncbi:hypothetical protein [Kutzneria chonburiensis]|uniref:Uncharacterized protein n=1 Tax=Kutzneria chonburiensis TaxID=1483604 RepID=A0ABV6MVN4_9PSEU|nr:hypothetical protein [Kutzneria chonburiensis]
MSTVERSPLIFRLIHPVRAAKITIESELALEFRGLRKATRVVGRWHRRVARTVDHGMRLGYAIERLCRRAVETESRPRKIGSQLLTAAQARRQLDRSPSVGTAELGRVVLAADAERRRLLRSVDRKIAELGRLAARLERDSERLQHLIERCYLGPQQDILLARSLARDPQADRLPVVRALPDLTFLVLAISRLEVVTHEASACREEAHGTRALFPFVPEQRLDPAVAVRN